MFEGPLGHVLERPSTDLQVFRYARLTEPWFSFACS